MSRSPGMKPKSDELRGHLRLRAVRYVTDVLFKRILDWVPALAKRAGHSAEEEARRILNAAVLPTERVKTGSTLEEVGRRFGGIELDIERDPTPAKGVSFEP